MTKRLGSPLRDVRAAAAVVGIVAAVVFANTLQNRFAYDDYHIIVNNAAVQSLESLPGAMVSPYWPGLYGRELGLWRPVTTALVGVQWVLGGGSPVLFHAVNVVAHAAASALVLLLLAALMPLAAAFAGGLVFAVHPVHVEAVANVIGVAEIASTIPVLVACLLHVRGDERTGWGRALGIGGLYALAFGAKESAVTLPAVLFVLDAARRRIAWRDLAAYARDRWRLYVVLALVAAAMLAGRWIILGSIASPFGPMGADLLAEIPRIWTLAEIWMHYVRLWVFPLDLASDYSPDVIPISTGWHAANVTGLLLALGVLVTALVAWRRQALGPHAPSARLASFGVVWFIVTISPVSNVLFLSGVLLAERTFYLPSVGLAAATGWLVVRLARDRPRGAWVVLAAALLLASARTWTRTPTWRTNATMLGTLIEDYPHSGRSQWILGDAFLRIGTMESALVSYRAAIDLLGTHYQLVTEISQRLMEVEYYGAAEGLLRYAWAGHPEHALAPSLLAAIRAERGDAAGTERYARASLELYDPDPVRHHLLAWALATRGAWDAARASRRRAEELAQVRTWQRWLYDAYAGRRRSEPAEVRGALDSAWATVRTQTGRRALDSIRVADFGLEPLLEPLVGASPAAGEPPGRDARRQGTRGR